VRSTRPFVVIGHALVLLAASAAVTSAQTGSGFQRGYPPYRGRPMMDELTSSIRLAVKPREAEVFVDGRPAGFVDDYDGLLQRLRVRPGEHEITIYLDGYRTVRQRVSLRFNEDRKIALEMEKLAPGEAQEPRPTPAAIVPDERSAADPRTLGKLTVRVQPVDAEIFVDGERWMTPEGQDRLVVELPEGRHRVEARKAGFAPFAADVDVRRGETKTLNVSLLKAG
jgi:hypothetical protein